MLPPLIYSWHGILYHRILFMSVYNQSTLSLLFRENTQLNLQRLCDFLQQVFIANAPCIASKLCFIYCGDLFDQRYTCMLKASCCLLWKPHVCRHIHSFQLGCNGDYCNHRCMCISCIVADNKHRPESGLAAAGGSSQIRIIDFSSAAHISPPYPAYMPPSPDRVEHIEYRAPRWLSYAAFQRWRGSCVICLQSHPKSNRPAQDKP